MFKLTNEKDLEPIKIRKVALPKIKPNLFKVTGMQVVLNNHEKYAHIWQNTPKCVHNFNRSKWSMV